MEDGWDPISKYGLFSVFGENTLVIVLAVLCIMFEENALVIVLAVLCIMFRLSYGVCLGFHFKIWLIFRLWGEYTRNK